MKTKYNDNIQIPLYTQQTLFLELEHFSKGFFSERENCSPVRLICNMTLEVNN